MDTRREHSSSSTDVHQTREQQKGISSYDLAPPNLLRGLKGKMLNVDSIESGNLVGCESFTVAWRLTVVNEKPLNIESLACV